MAYPQVNGQAKNVMRTVMDDLKKRLEEAGGTWVEDLQHILWAYQMTPRKATTETPFTLTYEFEAKLSMEVFHPTQRVEEYEDESNEELLRIEKNFIEERRGAVGRRMAEYQHAVKRYQNARAKPRYFDVGDLVLRDRSERKPLEAGKMAKN